MSLGKFSACACDSCGGRPSAGNRSAGSNRERIGPREANAFGMVVSGKSSVECGH